MTELTAREMARPFVQVHHKAYPLPKLYHLCFQRRPQLFERHTPGDCLLQNHQISSKRSQNWQNFVPEHPNNRCRRLQLETHRRELQANHSEFSILRDLAVLALDTHIHFPVSWGHSSDILSSLCRGTSTSLRPSPPFRHFLRITIRCCRMSRSHTKGPLFHH